MYNWDKRHRPDLTNDYDGSGTERVTLAERLIARYGEDRVFGVLYGICAALLAAQTIVLYVVRRGHVPLLVLLALLLVGLLVLLLGAGLYVYPQAFPSLFVGGIAMRETDRHGKLTPRAIEFRRMRGIPYIPLAFILMLVGAFAW